MTYYCGEQWDPDLGFYYLRARYYNPLSGRFTGADPLTDEGQPRYEYAGADPVDGTDPNGTEDLVEYRPIFGGKGLFPSINFPTLPTHPPCQGSGGPMSDFLPQCGEPTPPPPPPHWKVKVDWRSLLTGEFPKKGPIRIYPLGLWHHTYIEIDEPSGAHDTWGVLGDPPNSGDNQEVRYDDGRNSPAGWSGSKEVPCSDSEAAELKYLLNLTVYPSSICPSTPLFLVKSPPCPAAPPHRT